MPQRVVDSLDELRSLEGQEVGVGEWMEITQKMIDGFADLTHDHQWIHVDTKRAAVESPYKTTIAHGFLTMSLLPISFYQTISVKDGARWWINYGLNRTRFPAPVLAGSRVRARFRLQSLKDIPGGAQTTWDVTVETEGSDKPCVVVEWVLRAYRELP